MLMIKIYVYGEYTVSCLVDASGISTTNDYLNKIERRIVLHKDDCALDSTHSNKYEPKVVTNVLFLKGFISELWNSMIYRQCCIQHFYKVCKIRNEQSNITMKLKLRPPDQEIIDYAWNERMLRIVWSRIELEHALSWLSTLGGAFSALGDYYTHCAEMAGKISIRQLQLSEVLGDDGLAARSRLYSALAFSQKGKLKLAKKIVTDVADFAKKSNDKRLYRMCQGVWAKLQYLYRLKGKKNSKRNRDVVRSNGDFLESERDSKYNSNCIKNNNSVTDSVHRLG